MDALSRRRLLWAVVAVSVGWFAVRGDRVTPGDDILDFFDRQVDALVAGYERTPIATTGVCARRELLAVQSLLTECSFPAAVEVGLHRAAGRLGALDAATRADLGDQLGATIEFGEAFRHADLALDRTLQGWIRCWQSTIARNQGKPDTAVALAQDATRWAGTASPIAARAAVLEAWAHAVRRDNWAVHDKVGLAWRIVGDLSPERHGAPGFSMDTMHTTSIGEMSAGVYVELGLPDMASVYVDSVLPELDRSNSTGRRSLARLSKAASAIDKREVEQAIRLVDEALDISSDRPSERMRHRGIQLAVGAQRQIGPHLGLAELVGRLRAWTPPFADA